MEFFDALDLVAIPRDQYNLVVAASTLQPTEEMMNGDGKLEINFRPSVLDNMEHWQVSRDDEQILRFIHNVEEFSNFNVNHQGPGVKSILTKVISLGIRFHMDL